MVSEDPASHEPTEADHSDGPIPDSPFHDDVHASEAACHPKDRQDQPFGTTKVHEHSAQATGLDSAVPYNAIGGVSFSMTKRQVPIDSCEFQAKRAKAMPLTCSPTAIWTQPNLELPNTSYIEQSSDMIQIHVSMWPEPLHTVQVPLGTTVGTLIEAENKIRFRTDATQLKVYDVLGRNLQKDMFVMKDHVLILTSLDFSPRFEVANIPLHFTEAQRATFLWHQGGFVANDEMQFYLHQGQTQHSHVISVPMVVHAPAELHECLMEFLVQSIEVSQMNNLHPFRTATAILFQGHWFPLSIAIQDTQVTMRTTPEGFHLISQHAPAMTDPSYQWEILSTANAFDHDCGFQCIQWLSNEQSKSLTVDSMSGREAMVMRHEFAVFLQDVDTRTYRYQPGPILLGGATEAQMIEAMQELLQSHGVAIQ